MGLFSIFLSGVVISNAFYQKKQFYPSVLYITKSNPSMAVSIPPPDNCSTDDTLQNFHFFFHIIKKRKMSENNYNSCVFALISGNIFSIFSVSSNAR